MIKNNRMQYWGFLLAIGIIVLDQLSKIYVMSYLESVNFQPIQILPFFRIVLVYNSGISFGMFSNVEHARYIFVVISCLITLILCYWLFTTKEKDTIILLGLIIGGAVGNIVDRIRFGAVVDFLDFYIGQYHWPAFNIADSTIFIGVALLCIRQLWNTQQKG